MSAVQLRMSNAQLTDDDVEAFASFFSSMTDRGSISDIYDAFVARAQGVVKVCLPVSLFCLSANHCSCSPALKRLSPPHRSCGSPLSPPRVHATPCSCHHPPPPV